MLGILDIIQGKAEYFSAWMGASVLGHVFTIAAIAFAAMLVRGAISFVANSVLKFLVARNLPYEVEKGVREVLRPLLFVPIVAGVYLAVSAVPVPSKLVFYTHGLWKSLLTFNIVWILYSLVGPIGMALHRRDQDGLHDVVITWFVRIVRLLIILIAGIAFLGHWNINFGALAASIGIVGLPLALGAQDMLKNVVSGMSILSEKRFNVGDIVRIDASPAPIEGIVENIGFRSTKIRKFDKTPMFVPNNTLADGAVINVSNRLYRRIEWSVRLELRTSGEQLRYIRQEVENYITLSQDFVKPPEAPVQVRLDHISDSAVQMLVYCFTSTNVWVDYMRIKEELLLKVKEIVEVSGAAFALPSNSTYIEKYDRVSRHPILPRELAKKLAPAEAVLDEQEESITEGI
jgi:MscS family membrane protein